MTPDWRRVAIAPALLPFATTPSRWSQSYVRDPSGCPAVRASRVGLWTTLHETLADYRYFKNKIPPVAGGT